MLDGEPVPYALARIPSPEDSRGNLVMGATGEGRELTDRDPGPGELYLEAFVDDLTPPSTTCPLFTDGFESGDTSRWSHVVGLTD